MDEDRRTVAVRAGMRTLPHRTPALRSATVSDTKADTTPAPTYTCPSCGKVWYSSAVADDCCGDWLGYD